MVTAGDKAPPGKATISGRYCTHISKLVFTKTSAHVVEGQPKPNLVMWRPFKNSSAPITDGHQVTVPSYS